MYKPTSENKSIVSKKKITCKNRTIMSTIHMNRDESGINLKINESCTKMTWK